MCSIFRKVNFIELKITNDSKIVFFLRIIFKMNWKADKISENIKSEKSYLSLSLELKMVKLINKVVICGKMW
jgi:hypothetical protein